MFKTINGWTKVKMIQELRKYLPKDGSRCMQDPRTCVYENDKGERCAAGAFIPDRSIRVYSVRTITDLLEDCPQLKDITAGYPR